jgi:hypothetical protein
MLRSSTKRTRQNQRFREIEKGWKLVIKREKA